MNDKIHMSECDSLLIRILSFVIHHVTCIKHHALLSCLPLHMLLMTSNMMQSDVQSHHAIRLMQQMELHAMMDVWLMCTHPKDHEQRDLESFEHTRLLDPHQTCCHNP